MKKTMSMLFAALIALSMLCTAACGDDIVPIGLIAVPIEEQHTTESGVVLMESSVDAVEFTGGGNGAAAAMTRTYAEIFSSRAQQYISDAAADATAFYLSYGNDGSISSFSQMAGVLRSDDRLFVLSVTTDSYSIGAAHGVIAREAVCFNPIDGAMLSLSALTADGSDPTDKLAALLAEKYTLSEYAEGYGYDANEAAEVIKIMLGDGIYQWYITDGFVLICNPYDLAPHAMGGFELKLTSEALNGIVESKWFAEGKVQLPEELQDGTSTDNSAVLPNNGEEDNGFTGEHGQPEIDPKEAAPNPFTTLYDTEAANRFRFIYPVEIPSEYMEECLIWWNCTVYDITIYELEWDENYDTVVGGNIIYEQSDCTPEEALLFRASIPEIIPSHGMGITVNGVRYNWALCYNGRDGGLYFMEIDPQAAG